MAEILTPIGGIVILLLVIFKLLYSILSAVAEQRATHQIIEISEDEVEDGLVEIVAGSGYAIITNVETGERHVYELASLQVAGGGKKKKKGKVYPNVGAIPALFR